jgi:UDP-3-O-[3-hydroxymyristoyl] N-acetylglucosamine deacetylase/3-hydroxyacyl-[acyl-carrier-protein] dehydratase
MNQRTITHESCISGIGIHTGCKSILRFIPAETNSGIIFVRTDLKNSPAVSAELINVSNTDRATTLSSDDVKIRTVEHLMSAIFGLGISNLRIELDGEEIPILDGSSKIYCDVLESCGFTEQSGEIKRHIIQKKLSFSGKKNGSLIKISPCDSFQITYYLNYADTIKQSYTYKFSPETYYPEIAPARTFSLLSELEYLLDKGLLNGIKESEGFAVVDDRSKINEFSAKFSVNMDDFLHTDGELSIISKEKLRFPDELARHKILDVIGDFALCGMDLWGHIEAFGTGHFENHELIKRIFPNK